MPLISFEVIDGLFLWPVLAAVAAVTLVAGRRTAEDIEGRVGGLLSPVPETLRDASGGFDLEDAAVVAGVLRFAVMERRFGGTPFLGGDLGIVRDGLSCRDVVSDIIADWLVSGDPSNPISWGCELNRERDSAEGPTLTEAIAAR